jgi:hypothetical protein
LSVTGTLRNTPIGHQSFALVRKNLESPAGSGYAAQIIVARSGKLGGEDRMKLRCSIMLVSLLALVSSARASITGANAVAPSNP